MSGPISKASGALLDWLGITKNSANFINSLNEEIRSTVNLHPFLSGNLVSAGAAGQVTANGFNGIYTNTTGRIQFVYSATILTPAVLGAGASLDGRVAVLSYNTSTFPHVSILSPRNASAVGQFFCTGQQFFADPIPLQPQDVVGLWCDGTSGVINIECRLIVMPN